MSNRNEQTNNQEDTKCLVFGCKNTKSQGRFEGDLCFPCFATLTSGNIQSGTTFIHKLNRKLNQIKSILRDDNCDSDS